MINKNEQEVHTYQIDASFILMNELISHLLIAYNNNKNWLYQGNIDQYSLIGSERDDTNNTTDRYLHNWESFYRSNIEYHFHCHLAEKLAISRHKNRNQNYNSDMRALVEIFKASIALSLA